MIRQLLLYILVTSMAACSNKKNAETSGWRLVWSDDFNYTGLPDITKWNYDVGGHGWGNHELQYYTKDDTTTAVVYDGSLHIRAVKNTIIDTNKFFSARLLTKGRQTFHYGKIEVRAKLPKGRGLWPAIWMLGNNIDTAGWPACGETDIMEHVGFMPDSVFGSIHTTAFNHMIHTQRTKGLFIADPYTAFHTYAVDWTAEKISFFVDDKPYLEFSNTHNGNDEWPFDKPMFIILNLAVGGDWGGQQGVDDSIFPAEMQVDYVRVYQE